MGRWMREVWNSSVAPPVSDSEGAWQTAEEEEEVGRVSPEVASTAALYSFVAEARKRVLINAGGRVDADADDDEEEGTKRRWSVSMRGEEGAEAALRSASAGGWFEA